MSNPFLTKKDSLVEAVQSAMQDGEIRRQAEALVNEEFGVYSRKAVVREQLAAYDARLEEAYKCMKEAPDTGESDARKTVTSSKEAKEKVFAKHKERVKKLDNPKADYSKMREKMVGKGKDLETTRKIVGEAKKLADKDYDKDGKIESPKDEVWGSRFRAAKMAGKMEEEQIEEGQVTGPRSYKGSPDRKRKAVQMALGRKHKDHPDWNPRTNPQYSALKLGRKLQKQGVTEEEQIEEGQVTGPRSYKGSPDRKRKAVQMALGRKHKDHPDWNPRTNPQYSALKLGRKLQKQGVTEEEQIDEVSAGLAQRAAHRAFVKSDKMKADAKKEPDMHSYVQAFHKGEKKSKQGTKFAKYAAKKMEEENLDEAAYSAKAARAGKDIGKPGKMFSKIAKKAGEKYGSEERGKKVAGAILKRIRAKHMKEENLEELSAFGREFAAARKAGQTQFMSKVTGKMTSTALKGQTGTSSAPRATSTSAPAKQPGAPDETSTQSFLKSQGVGVKPPEQRAAPSMSAMDPKATRLTPSAPVSNQSAASGNLPSMASGLAGSTGAKSPTLAPSAPKPTKGFADPGAMENKARATGSLKESVQVGDYKYRIV